MEFYVAQYEHWSSGSASAIFESEEAAKAAFFGGANVIIASDVPLDSLIKSQEKWLEDSEKRLGYYYDEPTTEQIEEEGAIWAAHRK
jgi:hypothetical protein